MMISIFPDNRFKIKLQTKEVFRIEKVKSLAIKDLLPIILTIAFLSYMTLRSNYMSNSTLITIGLVLLFNVYQMIEPIKSLLNPEFFEFNKSKNLYTSLDNSKQLSAIQTIEMISLFSGKNSHKFSLKLRFNDGSSQKLDYSGFEEEIADIAHEISVFIGKPIERI